MSIELMKRVWELKLPTNAKTVLLAYADHGKPDGTGIFPSVALLARKTGYSERQVQRITRRLSQYLIPDGTGPRGTSRWRLRIPDDLGESAVTGVTSPAPLETKAPSAAEPASGQSPRSRVEHVTSVGSVNHAMSPLTAARATPEATDGDTRTEQTVASVSPEPSLIIKEPPTRAGLRRAEFEKADAPVVSPPAAAPRITYTNRDRIPERYLELADVFHEVTGLVPTQPVLPDWLREFSVWLSEGIRPEHVRRAHKEAGARISITRPGSLTRLAAAVKARGRVAGGAVKDADWHRRADEHTERSVAEGRRRAAEWYRSHNMPYEDPETMRPRIEDNPKLPGVESEGEPVVRASEEARAKLRELVKRLSVKKD